MYTPKTYTGTVTAADLNRMEAELLAITQRRGEAPLDSFAGADDDAKMVAAMSYAGAQTYTPVITGGNRLHVFTKSLGQPPDNWMFLGPGRGWLAAELSLYNAHIQLNLGAQTWIDCTTGTPRGYRVEGFSFSGNSTSQFIGTSGTAVLWQSTFRNLFFQNIKSVFGNSTTKLTTDLITIDGVWTILNTYDTMVNIGGADNRGIFSQGGNFGNGSIPVGGGGGKYMMMFSGHSKGEIGPVYITADNGWRGVKFTGSGASGYGQTIRGAIIEGRNAGDPCEGNLIRVDGGCVMIRDCCVNSGMSAPLASEHGLIEVTGVDTQVGVDGLHVSHATGVPVNTPVVYSSVTGNGWVQANYVFRHTRQGGPVWGTQKPVASGTLVAVDGTMSLV